MKDRIFSIILFSVIGIGVLLTAAHMIYAAYAYEHCSIIYFIGKEIWG